MRQIQSLLDQRFQAVAGMGCYRNDGAAQPLRQLFDVNGAAVAAEQILFVKSDNNGQAEFKQLGCEKQAAFETARVNNIDNHVDGFIKNKIARDGFFLSVWGNGIGSG